jgi:hypothetical protein
VTELSNIGALCTNIEQKGDYAVSIYKECDYSKTDTVHAGYIILSFELAD